MSKLTIQNMSFYYTDFYHPVFQNVNLVLDTDWKLGLIGRNGRGKTTLLHLLSQKVQPTAGGIHTPVRMFYFPYEEENSYQKAMDWVKEAVGGLKSMEEEMEAMVEKQDAALSDVYCAIQQRYQELDGYQMEGKIQREAAAMGLEPAVLQRDWKTLSGGEQTKLKLCAMFLRKDAFLLLDEPTNHLDAKGKEDLANYLKGKKGYMVVSHDRQFLDQVTDHILSINKTNLSLEKGTYSSWKANQERKEQFELAVKAKLEREIRHLERESEKKQEWMEVGNKQKYPYKSNHRTNGNKAYAGQKRRGQIRIQTNLEEKKGLLKNMETAHAWEIQETDFAEEGWMIRADCLHFSFAHTDEELFDGLCFKLYPGERIWLRGKNGAGKTTLFRLLSGEWENDAVEWAEGLKIGWVRQEARWRSGFLRDHLDTPEGKRKRKRFLELCRCFDLPEGFWNRPLETYSSGEQKKVELAWVLAGENHVVFLDEPLNYMEILFREKLEEVILSDQPTLIFTEHDTDFANRIATRVVDL